MELSRLAGKRWIVFLFINKWVGCVLVSVSVPAVISWGGFWQLCCSDTTHLSQKQKQPLKLYCLVYVHHFNLRKSIFACSSVFCLLSLLGKQGVKIQGQNSEHLIKGSPSSRYLLFLSKPSKYITKSLFDGCICTFFRNGYFTPKFY